MIKLFRLVSSEEIVGEIVSEENGTYTIKNPCAIGLAMGQNGQPTLSMQPWLIFSDQKEVSLKDNHILFTTTVDIKILNKYNEIFGSGIVIAQQKIVS